MNEEYHLGQIYKKLYIDTGFLSEQYVKAEVCCTFIAPPIMLSLCYLFVQVYIRSTDVDRALMSGQSMLSALYPPNDSQVPKTLSHADHVMITCTSLISLYKIIIYTLKVKILHLQCYST